jgi:hypothetical protein
VVDFELLRESVKAKFANKEKLIPINMKALEEGEKAASRDYDCKRAANRPHCNFSSTALDEYRISNTEFQTPKFGLGVRRQCCYL